MRFQKAPSGWSCSDRNPFSADGSYSFKWSAFCLEDRDDDQLITGRVGSGPFSARLGRGVPHLVNRLADFLRYENAQGRTVILSFPPGVDVDQFVAQAVSQTPDPPVVRPTDPAVLVHATEKTAWQEILADGELKAASLLANKRRVSTDTNPPDLAQYLSHEPPEYRDYIMFSDMESRVPEMVVASAQTGRFVLDENAVYEPGVRLYLDNHRIIRDGLGTRDGLHVMKVHQRLPLGPYLLAAIRVEDVDPDGSLSPWTLKAFVEKANAAFRSGHPLD